MTRKVILHIGAPKCGSTYLQRVLLNNRVQLARSGYSYPHSGQGHPGNAADIAEMTGEKFDALMGSAHTLILSHEDLFATAARARPLARIAENRGVLVQLVAFLRPFSGFIFGDYSQFMKQYFSRFLALREPYGGRNFEAFAADRSQMIDAAAHFRRWQNLFPQAPLVLAKHSEIQTVFGGLIGQEGLHWDVPKDQTNPSLRMQDCSEIAQAMRDPGIAEGDIRKLFRAAFLAVDQPDSGKSPDRIAWVEDLFESQNQALLEHFGFDNRLILPAQKAVAGRV